MYKLQVQKLLKVPKIQQKTKEWYDARNNLITASDFAQALGEGKFGTQKQLIEKKVQIHDESKPIKNIFFEWGNLFEPVACDVYSYLNNVHVHEFGLLRHPVHSFFGASPDGITDDGIMLEIKCPFKRKITGEIPMQYYYQIQGQLDVCELQECDYLECEFAKFMDYDEYKSSYEDGKFTGIITEDDEKKYIYGKVNETLCEEQKEGRAIYWILNKHFIKRVTKDEEFVKEKLKELEKVWKKILYYRQNPDKYKMEVKQSFSIETSSYGNNTNIKSKPSNGCMIIDLE